MDGPKFIEPDADRRDIIRVLNDLIRSDWRDQKMLKALEERLLGERAPDFEVTGARLDGGMAGKVDAIYESSQNGGVRSKPSKAFAVWGTIVVAFISAFSAIIVAIISRGG